MGTERTYNFKPVEDLVFTDDFMFGAVMREPEICKGVLERLLHTRIDHIEYPELQKSISPFYTRKGVRLDVFVADSDKVYDVECQSYKVEDIGKRTRYYQSMIDIDSLLKGAVYSELKESYVIFICTSDPFESGLPVYTFERKPMNFRVAKTHGRQTDSRPVRGASRNVRVSERVARGRNVRISERVELKDETHHLIFNASAYEQEDDPELRDFLSFVRNNTAESDFTRGIANMVQTKKFEQTFINEYLAWNLHDKDVELRGKKAGLAEGKKAGLAEGKSEGLKMTARNMLADKIPLEKIARYTGLSLPEVENLASRQ